MRPTILFAVLALPLGCNGRDDGDRHRDPGTVTLHRLNKAEYDATVRDLMGTTLTPARDFPDDDFGSGFDNMADVLSLSPLHLEMYERAADALIDDTVGAGPPPPTLWSWEAESSEVVQSVGGDYAGYAWMLWANGTVSTVWSSPHTGTYTFTARAFGTWAVGVPPELELQVDGVPVLTADIPGDASTPDVVSVDTVIPEGAHTIAVAFTNDYYDEGSGEDRNLVVDWFELEGPHDGPWDPPDTRADILACEPPEGGELDCVTRTIESFGLRAWRRPLTSDEVSGLVSLYQLSRDSGGDWEEGVRIALKAMLVSPNFTFRVETDPVPDSGTSHPVNPYELACRLSYFLWSSMPDDELFALAEDGSLLQDEVLESQVRRMVRDPKASALVDNFAGQWLLIRAVDDVFPDYAVFPDWDEELQASMKEEMRLFTEHVLLDDRSMLDLFTAPETFIDQRLAQHYGLPAPSGPGFEWVSLQGQPRAGIVTQGGLLTATSYPTRTSPVKRGKWVLSNLTCESPPPPPPEVEGLPEEEGEGLSIREQMEQHRSDPICASCHTLMDPIGFSFENYDATGAYRTIDETGSPIDSTGELPDGTRFDHVIDLMESLVQSPKVSACITRKAFTYAVGRPPGIEDVPYLEDIEADFVSADHRFEDLAVAIALSQPFRYRGGGTGR